jgi:hypothetical protein
MDSPRLELVRSKDPLNGLRRDRLDDAIFFQRARQLSAGPKRQRSTRGVRQLTRQLHQIQRDRGGKNGLDAHFEEHRPTLLDASE